MPKYTDRAKQRIAQELTRYSKILAGAADRGINEADTSAIVKDMLGDVLGYDKYLEVTSEYQIRGRFADFVVKRDDKALLAVECKAISHELRERDLFQVVGYIANLGLDWAVLTNGRRWECYRMQKGQTELLFSVEVPTGSPAQETVDHFYLLAKEAMWKGELAAAWEERQAMKPANIVRAILTARALKAIRLELKEIAQYPIDDEKLRQALAHEVLRRDVYEQVADALSPAPSPGGRRRGTKSGRGPECHAYVGDPSRKSTWKLPYRLADGSIDVPRLEAATAALSPGGHRGRPVELPTEALAEVRRKLREAYEELGRPVPAGLLPGAEPISQSAPSGGPGSAI
ncbi:MAG: type I restriction enzyme HsdR N-terminal domain-containing protein [Armatimonadetes bacterium]|nr:type I restriction enzyme HsdR N-terminal domain-containing protein [Armatimonadota bacterium]